MGGKGGFKLENGDILLSHYRESSESTTIFSTSQAAPQRQQYSRDVKIEVHIKVMRHGNSEFYVKQSRSTSKSMGVLREHEDIEIYSNNLLISRNRVIKTKAVSGSGTEKEFLRCYYHKPPLNYTWTRTYINEGKSSYSEMSNKIISIFEVKEDVVKGKKVQSTVSFSSGYYSKSQSLDTVEGHGTVNASLVDYDLTFSPHVNDWNFASLLPFEEGKKFVFETPITLHVHGESIIENKYPSAPAEIKFVQRNLEISGKMRMVIELKDKTTYQLSENITVEAYNFKYTIEEEKSNTGDTVSEFKAKGKVAYVGIPLVLEYKAINTSEKVLGETTILFKQNVEYHVKLLKKAKEEKPLETIDINKILPPIETTMKEIEHMSEEILKLKEKAVKKKPPEAARKVTEKKARVEQAKKVVAHKEKIQEVKKKPQQTTRTTTPPKLKREEKPQQAVKKERRETIPSTAKTLPVKRTEHVMKEETAEEISEEIGVAVGEGEERFLGAIKAARDRYAELIKSYDDLARFYVSNKSGFEVDPITRKAFLSYLKTRLGVDNEKIDEELIAPLDKLVNKPLDWLNEIIESMSPEAYNEMYRKLESIDKLEEQRRKDIIRIKKEIIKVGKEYLSELLKCEEAYNALAENLCEEVVEEHEELFDYLGDSGLLAFLDADPKLFLEMFIDTLGDDVSKVFEPLDEFLTIADTAIKGLEMIASATRLFKLHNKLIDLRHKLKLVEEGILIRPTLD